MLVSCSIFSSYVAFTMYLDIYTIALVRFAEKTSRNIIPVDLLWERKHCFGWKASWKVRIIRQANRAYVEHVIKVSLKSRNSLPFKKDGVLEIWVVVGSLKCVMVKVKGRGWRKLRVVVSEGRCRQYVEHWGELLLWLTSRTNGDERVLEVGALYSHNFW